MIAIIDYGMGNLKSVYKAFKFLGFDVIISSDASEIQKADKICLPGVGAFKDGMMNLKKSGLDKVIIDAVKDNKPILGICLGMQLLFDRSYEFGLCDGLGLISGDVVRIDDQEGSLKIPHIGWNELEYSNNVLFNGVIDPYVYFVHSYYVKTNEENIIAKTNYGSSLTAAVCQSNIYACQFHPEKSGNTGMKILKNFGDLK